MTDAELERSLVSWLSLRGYLIQKLEPGEIKGTFELPPTMPDPFDEWYDLYPRKVGPSDARKAYNKALARGAGHGSLCEAVRAQIRPGGSLNKSGADKKFIPHPSRWLNDSRWLEDWDARADNVVPFKKPQVGGRTRSALDDFLNEED